MPACRGFLLHIPARPQQLEAAPPARRSTVGPDPISNRSRRPPLGERAGDFSCLRGWLGALVRTLALEKGIRPSQRSVAPHPIGPSGVRGRCVTRLGASRESPYMKRWVRRRRSVREWTLHSHAAASRRRVTGSCSSRPVARLTSDRYRVHSASTVQGAGSPGVPVAEMSLSESTTTWTGSW